MWISPFFYGGYRRETAATSFYSLNNLPGPFLPTVHIDGGSERSGFTWIDFVMSRDFDLVFESSYILTVVIGHPFYSILE